MNAVSPRLNPTLLQPKRSSKTARPLTPAAHTAPPFNPLGNGAGARPPGEPAAARLIPSLRTQGLHNLSFLLDYRSAIRHDTLVWTARRAGLIPTLQSLAGLSLRTTGAQAPARRFVRSSCHAR